MPVKGLIHYALEVPDAVVGETFYKDFGLQSGEGQGNSLTMRTARGTSDLLLYDLATGSEMNIGNVADFSFGKKGDWMAYIIDAADKAGNGVMLRNMSTGAIMPLDNATAVYKGLTWTEKGDGLATLG